MDHDHLGFSDDDLDDLPANTLQHLEANAIRATQQRQQTHPPSESDYGLDDDGDEVINLDQGSEVLHLDHVAAQAQQYAHARHDYDYTTNNDNNNTHDALYGDDMDLEELAGPNQQLLRINKLEQERDLERKLAQDLRAKLQTKEGEADTLRRRQDADRRQNERRLADAKASHDAELAQLRAENERLKREREQAQTHSMFDQHDARNHDLAQRTRRGGLPSRPKPATTAPTSPAASPKRAHQARGPLGDGFDDHDVVMASPSKHRDRQKTATPRQAGKRKRLAIDQSPIPMPALQLSEPPTRPKEKEPPPPVRPKIDVTLLQHFQKDDRRFTLLHRLLAHKSSNGKDRILEALAQHSFPSQPSKKLSSLVYDGLSAATMSDVHELALQICHIFLDLWQRCLDEKHYAPMNLMFDALHFLLACEPGKTAVQLTERAVPLIVASIDLFAYPVARAAKQGGKAIEFLYSAAQREIRLQVNALDCLELLYVISTSCVSSTEAEAMSRLWRNIPSETAVMLLNKEHPRPQITLMLRILSTSALPTSIGPIVSSDPQQDSQAAREDALINRLTNMFSEIPTPLPDPSSSTAPSPASESQVWDLRLLVLSVLTEFSMPVAGCARLASNRVCIGRLIKYLDTCITSLYAQPLSPDQGRKVASINATMKLIYQIVTSKESFDIKSKLVNTLGGQHAYLVSLTRLAFSEGLVLEEGIEDQVVDMAHAVLDGGLSPEEGEAFGTVFGSGSSG